MARLRTMLKTFLFEETFRKSMAELQAGVRLHPQRNRLELMPVGGVYPTTADLFARTRVTRPQACRGWTGFFVVLKNVKGPGNVVLTDVRFKLNDGTTDRYWNSGANAWVPAALNNWNTEEEVANNIDKWPSQSLQVVINLSTTDPTVTPYVEEVRLSYATDLIFLEDYVARSFIAELKENVRPISHMKVTSSGQTSIDLSTIQTPYDIVEVDSVYNDTADPDHFAPLAGTSYDVNTKLLSIPAQAAGSVITVRFKWAPDVVLRKSQDFIEIGKIPCIVITDHALQNRREVEGKPYVVNKATGAGLAMSDGYQADIALPLLFMTANARDQHVLEQELQRYFNNNPELIARGQDEGFQMEVTVDFGDVSTPSQKEVHSGRLTVHVRNAIFYPEDAQAITGVKRFNVTGGNVTFEVTT